MLLERPSVYPNGIAFDAQGRLYWTESMGHRVCRLEDGKATTFAQLSDGHVPDGMAFAADGRLFVCTTISGGLTVLSPEGEVLEEITLGECATNCIFDGPTLYVTATKVADLGADQTHRHVLERRDRRDRRPAAHSREAVAPRAPPAASDSSHATAAASVPNASGGRARHARAVAVAHRVQEARDRRLARVRARDGLDGHAVRVTVQAEVGIEVEVQRDVRGEHVQRVDRRLLRLGPRDEDAAESAAAKRRVSTIASSSSPVSVPASARCPVDADACTDSTGPASASWRSMSWLPSSNRMPPLRSGSTNHDAPPAPAAARRSPRPLSVGPKLRLTSMPGAAPRRCSRSSLTTSRLRHW